MVTDKAINLIKDLEHGADLMENNNENIYKYSEIEEKINLFVKLPLSFDECLSLLGITSKPFVHFQICKLLKNVVLSNFPHCLSDTEHLLNSLFSLVKQMPQVSYYVENGFIEILCLTNKKLLTFNSPPPPHETLNSMMAAYVEELLTVEAAFAKKRGCLLMKAMISEVSSDSMNHLLGISQEQQKSLKIFFQESDLKRFMGICMSSLQLCCQHSEQPQWLAAVPAITSVMSDLFSWDFLLPTEDSRSHKMLLPSWHKLIFQSNLAAMLYEVFQKIRSISRDVGVQILQCASLLATTNATVLLLDSSLKMDFLTNSITFFLSTCSLPDIHESEVLEFSRAMQNLTTFNAGNIVLLDKRFVVNFFSVLTETTCHLCRLPSSEMNETTTESLENLLQSWFGMSNSLSSDGDRDVILEFRNCAERVFFFYLKSHISAPEGFRCPNDLVKESQVECTDEIENERDEIAFFENLVAVGMLGRISVEKNLPFLLECLFSKTEKLRESFLNNNELILMNIYEDIHWILLLLTEMLTNQDDSYSTIPSEVIRFSHSQPISDFNDNLTTSSNEFIKIMRWIQTFCGLEVEAEKLNLLQRFSPLLESSFVSFLSRFSSSYLMYKEESYSELSLCLVACFGCDSHSSALLVELLMEKIHFNLAVWSGEERIIECTLNLFHDISQNRDKRRVCLTSTAFWKILKENVMGCSRPLSEANKIKLLQNVFSVLPVQDDSLEMNLKTVLGLVEVQLKEVSSSIRVVDPTQGFTNFHLRLSNCFDWMLALAVSARRENYEEIYRCFAACWMDVIAVTDVLHNYAEVFEESFDIYVQISEHLVPFLSENHVAELFQSFLTQVKLYDKYYGSSREENEFNILCLILKTFNHFASKEVNKESGFSAFLSLGFVTVLPLCPQKILEFPEGGRLLSSLLANLAGQHLDVILSLKEQECIQVSFLVEHILMGGYHQDVTENCLEFVKLFAEGLNHSLSTHNSHAYLLGRRLFEVTLQMALYENLNLEMFNPIVTSLSFLITLYGQVYHDVVSQVGVGSPDINLLREKLHLFYEALRTMNQSGNKKTRMKNLQFVNTLLHELRGCLQNCKK